MNIHCRFNNKEVVFRLSLCPSGGAEAFLFVILWRDYHDVKNLIWMGNWYQKMKPRYRSLTTGFFMEMEFLKVFGPTEDVFLC